MGATSLLMPIKPGHILLKLNINMREHFFKIVSQFITHVVIMMLFSAVIQMP